MKWKVLRHKPIERISENVWRVEGALPHGPMTRVMTLVRLPDRRVVVHSAITLDDASLKEVEAWGTPSIVPNDRHRLDAAAYKTRYPDAQVVCPPGARSKVEDKVHVDATSIDLGPTATYRVLDGTNAGEGWLQVSEGGRTIAVLADLVMNLRPMKGLGGWIMNRMGFTGDLPKVVPATRKILVADPGAAAKQLESIAALPNLDTVIVAHGEPVTVDGLRAAANGLRST
jgi:hypothetical protein